MASFKFQSTPFTVESPDVTYTDAEILANYTYETVVVEGAKVRACLDSIERLDGSMDGATTPAPLVGGSVADLHHATPFHLAPGIETDMRTHRWCRRRRCTPSRRSGRCPRRASCSSAGAATTAPPPRPVRLVGGSKCMPRVGVGCGARVELGPYI